jgi:hypothetical protein
MCSISQPYRPPSFVTGIALIIIIIIIITIIMSLCACKPSLHPDEGLVRTYACRAIGSRESLDLISLMAFTTSYKVSLTLP